MSVTTSRIQRRMQKDLGLSDRDFAYHGSDMYVVLTEPVAQWLRTHEPKLQRTLFTSQKGSDWNGAGKICIEVAFAAMAELIADRRNPKHFAEYQSAPDIAGNSGVPAVVAGD